MSSATDTSASVPPGASDPSSTPTTTKGSRAQDFSWVISLFGTAVGAGILFLPINAGAGGIWPLLFVTIIIGPMVYFSHRALSRFVCVSPRKGEDITVVAGDYFGPGVGKAITILYFFAIYPIVLIYGVSITNTIDSLMVNQLGLPQVPRPILSFVLIALMMAVMIAGEKIMLAVTQFLVYPLIAALFIISLMLIPTWHIGDLAQLPEGGGGGLLMTTWLMIPVLVFAFNHSPAISAFSLAMQRAHGDKAAERASWVLKRTATILVVFTMLFVWSCVLSLGADGLAAAREANLPVLSYLANVNDTPAIAYAGPAIAIVAIGSSFFGHYLGAAEGAAGLVRGFTPGVYESLGKRKVSILVAAFMFLTTWIVAILNPSILGVIETLSGPVIAAILYIMPMIAISKVPALAPYRGKISNIFVVVMGVIAIGAILVSIVRLFA